jgi:YesN/AraC family two-component response regulator
MADIGEFIREYSDFKSSFKATSFDSENGEYLCFDESQEVINYDEIIEEEYPNSNRRPKSFDAIFVYENKIFCIEFKNQKPSQINNQDICEKLTAGKAELDKILQKLNIQSTHYDFVYCVAYKKCIEPHDRYKCGIDRGKVLFGLTQYKVQGIVKEIFTENVDFFTKQFKKQFNKELTC